MEKSPDLCMSCKVYEGCPFLEWEWCYQLEDFIAQSTLPIKPRVSLSVTTCDKYVA